MATMRKIIETAGQHDWLALPLGAAILLLAIPYGVFCLITGRR